MLHPAVLPALLLVTSLLAGCAKGTKITPVRHESRPAQAPYAKILVVGVTPNEGLRWRWERTMTATLQDEGLTAWSSVKIMGYETPLNRDNVVLAVRETGADAVLVSRLIRQDVAPKGVDARAEAKKRRRDQYVFDIFRYDYEEIEEPSYTLLTSTVEIGTDLYETTEGRLIYSLNTITYQKQTEWEVLDEVTIAITKRLRKDRMAKRR
jgi:hypothetical protein